MADTASKHIDMTTGSLWRNIPLFAFPVAATSILEQLSNLIATVIIGNFSGDQGTLAMAAVGSNVPLTSLMLNLFIGLSLGSNVVIANAIGRNDQNMVKRAVHTSILMALVGFVVIALGEIFAEPMLAALNVPAETMPLASLYLRVFLLSMPSILLYNFEAAIFRSVGITRMPLQALAVSTVLNIGLDLWFVLGLGWGVAGAAGATVLAQGVSAAGIALYGWRRVPLLRLERRHCKVSRGELGRIVNYSLLTCVQQSVMNFGILMVQGLVNSFGVNVMAAFAAAVKIDAFAYLPVQDFGNAFSTFVAQNTGAQKTERIRRGIRSAVGVSVGFCLVSSLLVCLFAAPLMGLFVEPGETEIIAVGVEYLRIEGMCYCGIGILFLLYGLFRGLGRPGVSVVLTVISLGTRVALAYLLAPIPAVGLKGIWWAVPIGWVLADLAGLVLYRRKPLPAETACAPEG